MSALADQIRLLLPPVSYDGMATNLSAAIEAEAGALDAIESDADAVYSAVFPDTGEGLSDWERVLALPDPCLGGLTQGVAGRLRAVVSKVQLRGGQSKSFFIALAKSLGYDITITTFRPAYAGTAQAGDPLYGGEWDFAWRVNAPLESIQYAAAGISGVGDPLATWGNKPLECRLSQMMPAESVLIFGYGDS